jgi:3'-phosphoadenosine 5'-phosphosulfate sulfotransferase (PAPS reductase)/FAD synthetase
MIHVLTLSYGKDSIACLYALREMRWPLERIIHVEVWATEYIPADLPEMVNFKKYADKKIKDEFGIDVEHVCAKDKNGEKLTYEKIFYRARKMARNGDEKHKINGWPLLNVPWCNSSLKLSALKLDSSKYIKYLGIAYDETKRYKILVNNKISPLIAIGWPEEKCYNICKENNLLSPLYMSSQRSGCWFCHNQTVNQLRTLRKKYPNLWHLMLAWDKDSPVTFKADGHKLTDYDRRFWLEDKGIISENERFRWDKILRQP